MASMTLSNFIVLQSYYQSDQGYANYKNDNSIVLGEKDVLSTRVKIAVEPATSDSRYVNLRFVYNNGYWSRNATNTNLNVVSTQPEEDITSPASTLFEPVAVAGQSQLFYLVHVQSGGRVRMNNSSTTFYLDVNAGASDGYLSYLDWDSLVKLPAHVAFKGDNNKYLQAVTLNNAGVLQFASLDPNEKSSGHQVSQMKDGRVQITSDLSGKMWWSKNDWVYSDWSAQWNPESAIFTPFKIDETTIALRSNGPYSSNNFCKRFTAAMPNCLAPAATAVSAEARLVVQELVQERTIYDAVYDMARARIYNETPLVVGKTTLVNSSQQAATMAVEITYPSQVSYTFTRSVSLTAGVKTTFQVGVPFVEKTGVVISSDINGTLDWDTTTTTTRSVKVFGSVVVPAKSSAVVEYVGTTASCDVPFSYSQKDVLSTDGATVTTNQTDGICTSVNSYNFNFQVASTTPV